MAIELWIYMNNSDSIIEWLESENVKTKQEALDKLEPFVGSNIRGWATSVGGGNYGGSLAGTAGCVKKVIKHFENKQN